MRYFHSDLAYRCIGLFWRTASTASNRAGNRLTRSGLTESLSLRELERVDHVHK